jgi:hypothetical protein
MHFARVVIPRMANNIRSSIKNGIDNYFYSITSDGWSSPTKAPFLQRFNMKIKLK